ncbi:MAG: polysaccharide lyase 10 [Tannerella sp.]|jgi:PelA/Pel-15E family pectate lyase|nr:polysaccharide lyase 10 [Tannerella sp.]
MKRKILLALLAISSLSASVQGESLKREAAEAMKRATVFMMDSAGRRGGFVWGYLPDFSRTWGELEAFPTTVWVQSPGTPAVGNILLDAFHATGDEYYYQMAERVANILVFGQLECGGWNYLFDLDGEASLRRWYATIGKNAWGCSEFNHYYGNATFDDGTTAGAANFILRMYLEKLDPRYKPSLEKAVRFVLESQYPAGGWPQRYPLRYDYPSRNGDPDYTSHITLNDAVVDDNIEWLTRCLHVLGDPRAGEALLKAMNCVKNLQQAAPTAGWADQYTLDLKPATAREFEPAAVSVSGTVNCIVNLMQYFGTTGDARFLSGIPAALDFLRSVAFKEEDARKFGKKVDAGQILCPRFLIPGTHTPLFIHRKGSHVNNGSYYTDQHPENLIEHYSSIATVNIDELTAAYESLAAAALASPPFHSSPASKLPEYYSGDLTAVDAGQAAQLIRSLDAKGRWLSPLTYISNPYTGEGDAGDPAPTLYRETLYGKYNTALYRPETPVQGLSTAAYIRNMFQLICYLKDGKAK